MANATTVSFLGSTLFIVEHHNEPYTPMKPIVDGMGLDWKSQHAKLMKRFAKGVVEITIPTPGGEQRMTCLVLRKLAAWLNSVSANKVNPAIRDRVIQYQERCDDVLYEYWMKEHGTPVVTPPDFPQRFIISCAGGEWRAQPIGNDEMVCNVPTLQGWIEEARYLNGEAVAGLLMSCARRLAGCK